MSEAMLKHMIDNKDIFLCPACKGCLDINIDLIECLQCNRKYKIENGVPLLFYEDNFNAGGNDITSKIKSFYEATPFPNYDNMENVSDLIKKAKEGVFAHLLDEQVPFRIRILEVGCGTGQMSNFLGISHRIVFGVDISINSLKIANDFRINNGLERVGFYQMNLFKPIFKEEAFSLVICNGVLHHTSDPFGGFQSISRLVKRGGYVIIGLYNKYGRITTDIRRSIFNIFGSNLKFLDARLIDKNIGEVKKLTWFVDQYKNPHESRHTIGEVLGWFRRAGFDFINGIPKPRPFCNFSRNERLFQPNHAGNQFDHFLIQAALIITGGREGGLFLLIGKRRDDI